MTPDRKNEPGERGLAAGRRAGSFTISTVAGRIAFDWIVPPPFGIDERSDDEFGGRS
jgi:hypothetical protein